MSKHDRFAPDLDGHQTELLATEISALSMAAKASKRLLHTDYYVGWICALPIEMTAARVMLDEIHISLPNPPGDDNVYILGSMSGHNVVIACLPSGVYGTTSATTVGIAMSTTFPNAIKIPLLVGIGGGVPRIIDDQWPDIRLGDVVVSTPTSEHPAVIQYDYGKTVKDGLSICKGTLNKPARILLNAISTFRSQHDIAPDGIAKHISRAFQHYGLKDFVYPGAEYDMLYEMDCDYDPADDAYIMCESETITLRESRPDSHPRIHYGSIASGNQVIKDHVTRDRIALSRNVLCFEMEAAGLMDLLSPLVIRGICDYCNSWKEKRYQRYSALTAAAYAKELLSLIPVHDSMATGELQYHRTEKDNATLAKIMLSDPRLDKKRIETTKGGLLRDSYKWVLESSEFKTWQRDKNLLWIRGDPGKGKTMLLCGIIDELQKTAHQNTLAYFFCQATNQAINTGAAVLRGLIYILADQNPALTSYVSSRLDRSSNVFDINSWYMLSQILEDMIAHTKDTYIIIDALDECIDQREDLLRFIVQNRGKATFVVSSRNWSDIEDAFRSEPSISLEVNAASVCHAIEYYIQFKVDELVATKGLDQDIKNTILAYLQQHANGTFLWVALVCMSLARLRKRHLKPALNQFPSDLNDVYERMWHTVEQNDDTELLQRILATCNIVVRPLTTQELRTVLEIDEDAADSLEEVIQDCGSFLTMKDDIIEFVHQSAKEFVDKKNRVALRLLHKEIFSRSMAALFRVLRRDIYGLKEPATSISEVRQPTSDPLVAIRYACINWSHHLIECGDFSLLEQTLLQRFLESLYLQWLEAMSLLRSTAAAVMAMHETEALVIETCMEMQTADSSNNSSNLALQALLYDARRFIQYFRGILESCPLQAYYSGLLFSPKDSVVRKSYSADALRSIQIMRFLSTSWAPSLTTFNLRSSDDTTTVTAVSFSPDSKHISVGYQDSFMQVWDLKSMVMLHSISLADPSNAVSDYCEQSMFLPHTQKILCQLHRGTASIWDLATTSKSDLGITDIVTISKDGIIARRKGSNSIRFLNALGIENQPEQYLELDMYAQPDKDDSYTRPGKSLVFAFDANIVAARTAADKVEIWSIDDLQCQGFILTQRHQHYLMALSTQYLCICETHETEIHVYEEMPFILGVEVNVYDIRSGQIVSSFPLELIAFVERARLEMLQDNRYIVSSHHGSYIYNITTDSCVWKYSEAQYCWVTPDLQHVVSLRGAKAPEPLFTVSESFMQQSALTLKHASDVILEGMSSDGQHILAVLSDVKGDTKVIGVESGETVYRCETRENLQFSSDLMLFMMQDTKDSDALIFRLLPDGPEALLTLEGMIKTRPGNGNFYKNIAFAPDNIHVAVVKRGKQVVIYHLSSAKELLSIACGISITDIKWAEDSSKVVIRGRKGFVLVDVLSKAELIRSQHALWMSFSESGNMGMLWFPDHSKSLVDPTRYLVIPPTLKHSGKQKTFDDEVEYEGMNGSEEFEAHHEDSTSIWLDADLKSCDYDSEEDEPKDESEKQAPPSGHCKVQGGAWMEWNIPKRRGRSLPKFHPELFLVNFCFNSQFLVAAEAPRHRGYVYPLTLRVWNRKSGKQCVLSDWNDHRFKLLKLQDDILHTNHGIITIAADDIQLGSKNDYFSDGQWLWLDNKRIAHVPSEYSRVDYRNKTFTFQRNGGGFLVLRSP